LALSSESSARIDLAGLEEVSDEVDDLLDDSHMVVVAIVANVANEQNLWLPQIPSCGYRKFRPLGLRVRIG
jgi:hypothetical protein